ncbi:thiol reductant ABC exporter subunit CydC [Peribacillus huizhouensis]|uniref:ATP-binding cassette subfamily C protein CydC n=1 Tax=Peribacillus huizhouensis TaxID=1501239 RepID=A0ABR6CPN9_9BACI|nr:thiol reductant ABC exporter subunit CydC [Peribacillus huizhouensis]MBA9026623.1 ATP-binding cassette subfamily C protein CydC [Peribacillus huizhouensis]
MRDLFQVIRLVTMEKKDILYTILFGFLSGIVAISLFAASGYLISKAALVPPLYTLTVLLALLKLCSIARALSRYAERFFSHRATFSILGNVRVSFFEKLEPLASGIFQKYRSGDLLSRIVGDVESLQNFFLRVFYPPIVFVLVFLSTIFFTSFYSVYVALSLLAGMILTGFIIPILFAIRQRDIEQGIQSERGELSTEVTEFFYGFRDLKIYQKLEEKERRLLQLSNLYIREQERKEGLTNFSQTLNTLVANCVSWAIVTLGAYQVVTGKLDGLYLAMLVMISLNVFEYSIPLAAFPVHFEDSRRAATRLFSVVEKNPPLKLELDSGMCNLGQGAIAIDIDKVSFSFSDHTRLVLNQVSLTLSAGSKTAIVGPSGSGKSTLLQLVMKMQNTDEGRILLNGTSIDMIEEESIWKSMNVILQENHFFYGTIKENLLLAKENATDDELKEVLVKVELDGYSLDQPVFEKGENLSGGEKQKLAIARTLLKRSRLWLLDEPTSSMDALTEQNVYRHLFKQAKDDTIVLISHRLTGLEQMDQIIVMDQGMVVESGSFTELMERRGYFYGMKQIEKSVLF